MDEHNEETTLIHFSDDDREAVRTAARVVENAARMLQETPIEEPWQALFEGEAVEGLMTLSGRLDGLAGRVPVSEAEEAMPA